MEYLYFIIYQKKNIALKKTLYKPHDFTIMKKPKDRENEGNIKEIE